MFWSGKEWDILVGSANLTVGGMTNNTELMLHVTSREQDSDDLKTRALEIVRSYYDQSQVVSRSRLNTYREQWKRRQIIEGKERRCRECIVVVDLEGVLQGNSEMFNNSSEKRSGDVVEVRTRRIC